jgi:hypothetical protein
MRDDDLINKLRKSYSAEDIETNDFNVEDMIFAFGSPLDAFLYLRLFWPEFVEINNMIFLKGMIESEKDNHRLATVFEQNEGNIQQTEQEFNLIEVPSDLFGQPDEEITEDEYHWLAKRLAEIWTYRLQSLFPQRQFVVKVLNSQETGGDVGILFHQKEP